MTGLAVARDLLLLGAECAVRTPLDEISYAHDGWTIHPERWAELRSRMQRTLDDRTDEFRRRLCETLPLSESGYWLVMLCAAVEVYPEAAAAASIICEQDRVHLLTPMTFARLLRSAAGVPIERGLLEAVDTGRARRLGLVEAAEPVSNRPVTQSAIRLATAELTAVLAGGAGMGAVQSGLSEAQEPAPHTVFEVELAEAGTRLLTERGVLCLRSQSPRAARQLALDICSRRNEVAQMVTVRDELPPVSGLARLREGTVFLDLCTWTRSQPLPPGRIEEMQSLLGRVMIGIDSGAANGPWPAINVPSIGYRESRRVWSLALGSENPSPTLAARFRVNLEDARAAIGAARDAHFLTEDAAPDEPAISEQLLLMGSRRMGKSVSQLRSAATLEHLVAPPAIRAKLDEIVIWFHHSGYVFGEMGLQGSTPLGRGLICLFSGPPGTGKTFAAQGLANRFGLNLYRIDLSQVVSKYIGETEKALAAVFDEAEAGHGLLLCDEADALFGKRSEVKDAHDRYANIEVGYLLQRLESFDGAVILATNLRNNIDPAFLRRIRFLLDFPMPDRTMRRQLWEQALPPVRFRHPGLDLTPFVDQFRLAGGNIQNIGLLASHLAAASPDGLVTAEHLVRATYRELEKNAQPREAADFGPLAMHLVTEAP